MLLLLRSRVSGKTSYLGFMISSSTDLAPSAQDLLQVGRYNRVRDRSQDETGFGGDIACINLL